MRYISIERCSVSNGVGNRVILWVSGCSLHCPGCHNQEAQDPNIGKIFSDNSLTELIIALNKPYIAGLTVSGGHPLEPYNCEGVYSVLTRVRKALPDKNIWLYTGFKWEEALKIKSNGVSPIDIMRLCDVVVDGDYKEEMRDITLAWRGSSNQRVIDVQKSLMRSEVILYCH